MIFCGVVCFLWFFMVTMEKNENSLDCFINDGKIMFYIKQSRLKIEQCGAK
jgi:hypothetical protein